MAHKTNGTLIVVEGIDGAGKSTLVKKLAALLRTNAHTVVKTKEPGGSNLGMQLREMLQHQPTPIAPRAEFLLFAADRAQHFNDVVMPALARGSLVISDRMGDSSLAYQGYGRGHSMQIIHTLNTWTMHGITPNITIYMRIPLDAAYERINVRNAERTVFEKQKKDFMERVAHGFEEIYKNRDDVLVLDATQDAETLAQQAYAYVQQWLKKQ